MFETSDLQRKVDELEDENASLLQKLHEAEREREFGEKKASDSLSFHETKLLQKKYFRTALFSCYLGGLLCGFVALKSTIFQAETLLDFLTLYGGLILLGFLGFIGIGFFSFGVSHFFFEEDRLPFWFWLLLVLIPPLFGFILVLR